MKFEKINYGSNNLKKGIVIGFVLCALVFVVINLFLTKAKYQLTESIPIARGTITTTGYDFKIMAMYIIDGENENPIDKMPESGYVINEDRSYCTLNNKDKDNNAILKTINGNHTIANLSKNEKCYLYFDKLVTPSENTLENLGIDNIVFGATCPDLDANGDGIITKAENTNAMMCKAKDDYGTSYYYRGKESDTNNWLVFGKDTTEGDKYIWWRIIRINGNGTIRLIYAGTSSSIIEAPPVIGETTMIKTNQNAGNDSYPRAVQFNEKNDDNKYMGYMYNITPIVSTTHEEAHKVTSGSAKSTILSQIILWYQQTNLSSLQKSYIDVDTGFCSDTTIDKEADVRFNGAGYGTQQTGYAPMARLYTNSEWKKSQTPTLKCGYTVSTQSTDKSARKRDLYTGPNATEGGIKESNGEFVEGNNALPVPVGLITSDEVVYAGGYGGNSVKEFWLYTNQNYWTMSPNYYYVGEYATVFRIDSMGVLNGANVQYRIFGVRPVINLKADVTFEPGGNGTPTNPYIVKTN